MPGNGQTTDDTYVIRLTACRDVGDSGVLQERQYGAEVYVCDAGGLVDESANY